MANRKVPFVNNEFYHVYNRGVDKRDIFSDQYDVDRFLQSMKEFNNMNPIGSIYEQSFKDDGGKSISYKINDNEKLVNVICYCLNNNHYHFILEQLVDGGISEFMKRLGGYTSYFNKKNTRSGALFQGVFKSAHIDSNEYLLHLSAYVNLNDRVHQLGGETPKLVKPASSWQEYSGDNANDFCKKDIILSQFKSKKNYIDYAEKSLGYILQRRKDLKKMLIEI